MAGGEGDGGESARAGGELECRLSLSERARGLGAAAAREAGGGARADWGRQQRGQPSAKRLAGDGGRARCLRAGARTELAVVVRPRCKLR